MILQSQIESIVPVKEFVTIDVPVELSELLRLLQENAVAIRKSEAERSALLRPGPYGKRIDELGQALGVLRDCRNEILDRIGREAEKNALMPPTEHALHDAGRALCQHEWTTAVDNLNDVYCRNCLHAK